MLVSLNHYHLVCEPSDRLIGSFYQHRLRIYADLVQCLLHVSIKAAFFKGFWQITKYMESHGLIQIIQK